jgi:hypothetical protein
MLKSNFNRSKNDPDCVETRFATTHNMVLNSAVRILAAFNHLSVQRSGNGFSASLSGCF